MKKNGKMNAFGGSTAFAINNGENNETTTATPAIVNETLKNSVDREIEADKKMKEKADSMEIVPCNQYVLVKPFAKNPFEQMEVTSNGLVIAKPDGTFDNPDTGEQDTEDNFSVQAVVIEVGPATKYVREGDVVYYRRMCGVPIPFYKQGFEVVAENQIQVILNEGVKERFANM